MARRLRVAHDDRARRADGRGDQRAYVERLDDAGVSAFALSARLHVPPLRPTFYAAAEERGLPVLEVPLPVPFIAVAQEVAAAVQADVNQRLDAQLQVFGVLRWLASEELTTAELFARLKRLSGYDLFLCAPDGRPLLPGVRAPENRHRALVPSGLDVPPAVPGGYVLPVPAPGGPAGYLLALDREGAQSAGFAVAQHVATVAALQLTNLRHERELLRREGAEALAELLAGAVDARTARRHFAHAGRDPETPAWLIAMRGHADGLDGRVARRLEEPHLLLRQQRDLYVLAPASASVHESLSAVPDAFSGASRPFAPGEPLSVPLREASWALARALESKQSFVVYGEDATNRWLPQEPGVLRGLVDHVVGAALRWSPRRSSWSAIAARRTPRASSTSIPTRSATGCAGSARSTGRELTSTADLAEVWLALCAAPARCAQSRPRGLTPRAAAEAPFSEAASGSCAPRAASDSHATCSRPRSSTVSWKTSGRL